MKNGKLLLSCLFLGSIPVPGDALLFRPHERDAILEARDGGGDSTLSEVAAPVLQKLYLAALIYTNPSEWSVWVNGQVIRPENSLSLDPWQLLEVTANAVKFVMHSQKSKVITLKTNETYDPQKDLISSGDRR